MPWIRKLEETYFITAGTATSRRWKAKYCPSFYILEIEEETALLKEVAGDKRIQLMLPVYIPIISLYGLVISKLKHIIEDYFGCI